MARYEHLPLYKKALDTAVSVENVVKGFSRYHKYTLGTDLRNQSRESVRLVIRANSQTDKSAALQLLRDSIEDLKVTIHLCKEVTAFKNFNTFQSLVEAATDMCRQCEGWIKSASKQNKGGIEVKKQRLLFIFFSAALLCCSVILSLSKDSHAATISLPATGQTKCYDTTGTEIACAGTGQDGEARAGVAWPSPRFTVSGKCVTDNLTGLIWSKNANLPNGTKTWQQALDYVASLNAKGGLCGQTDWRLPQIVELESLVHRGFNAETCGGSACTGNADWLNTQGFTNVQSDMYWSSSTNARYTDNAWYVAMVSGNVVFVKKTESLYVWPVRGGY